MPVYRTTILWGQSNMGASETYWTPNQPAATSAKLVETMLAMRVNLMTTQQNIYGIRVALEGAVRRSSLIIPLGGNFADSGVAINVPATGTIPPTGINGLMDQFRAILQMQLQFDGTRRTMRYLSGLPDAATLTEPGNLTTATPAQWWSAFNGWRDYLVSNGWQIRGQVLPPTAPIFPVIGLVQQDAAPGLIGVVIAATTTTTIVQGTRIALHGMRAAKGTRGSTMNGSWGVSSVDNTNLPQSVTVYLNGSAGIDPESQRWTMNTTLRPITYTTYPIQALVPFRAGVHKRGKPGLSPRGRRLIIKSLDP